MSQYSLIMLAIAYVTLAAAIISSLTLVNFMKIRSLREDFELLLQDFKILVSAHNAKVDCNAKVVQQQEEMRAEALKSNQPRAHDVNYAHEDDEGLKCVYIHWDTVLRCARCGETIDSITTNHKDCRRTLWKTSLKTKK